MSKDSIKGRPVFIDGLDIKHKGAIITGSVFIKGNLVVDGTIFPTQSGGSGSSVSSSYALTASYATFAQTAGSATTAGNASTANTANTATTASYALTASYVPQAISSSYSTTASFLSGFIQSASFAATAAYFSGSISNAINADTASFVKNAQTASYVVLAQTASYVATASFAISASYALSASYATTASFALNGGYNIIQASGSNLTQRTILNVYNGITASDSASNNRTEIKLGGILSDPSTILLISGSNYFQITTHLSGAPNFGSPDITFQIDKVNGFVVQGNGSMPITLQSNASSQAYSFVNVFPGSVQLYSNQGNISIGAGAGGGGFIAITGSVIISSGSVTGSIFSGSQFTGSFFGTSSWAINALTASTAISASYALTASYAANADLLDGKDSTIFATTGSNNFFGSQSIVGGPVIISGGFDIQSLGNSMWSVNSSSGYVMHNPSMSGLIIGSYNIGGYISASVLGVSRMFMTTTTQIVRANGDVLSGYIFNNTYNLGNFTGSTLVGFDYNPTIVSGSPGSHLAFRIVTGSILIGAGNSVIASASLHIVGRTSSSLSASLEIDNLAGSKILVVYDDGTISGSVIKATFTGSLFGTASFAASGGYRVVQDSGSALPQRPTLNFSNGLTASDSSTNNLTNVSIGGITRDSITLSLYNSGSFIIASSGSNNLNFLQSSFYIASGGINIQSIGLGNTITISSTNVSSSTEIMMSPTDINIIGPGASINIDAIDASSSNITLLSSNIIMRGSVTGSIFSGSQFSGSHFGTSSWALNSLASLSSSYAATASLLLGSIVSASYALTSSFALNGGGSGSGTSTPGGSNTQIQFNSASVFQGSPNFTFDYTNKILTLTGSSIVTGSLVVTGSLDVRENVSLFKTTSSFDGGVKVLYIGNRDTASTANPTGGMVFRVQDGNKIISRDTVGSESVLNILVGPTAPLLPVSGQLWVDTTFSGSDATASYALTASFLQGSVTSASYALSSSFSSTSSFLLGSIASSSYAANADLLDGKDSTIFATTGSNIFVGNQVITGSLIITGSQVDFTKVAIISGGIFSGSQFTGSFFGTSSWAINSITSSFAILASTLQVGATASYSNNADLLDGLDSTVFATTGSNIFKGNQTITGSLVITGSQVDFTKVGIISGSIFSGSQFTGSFFGTSSWASNAITSSYSLTTTSASFAATASFALNSAGSGTPGGSNTQIQFNSASVFQGSPNLTFDYVNKILILTGSSIITGSQVVSGSLDVIENVSLFKTTSSFDGGSRVLYIGNRLITSSANPTGGMVFKVEDGNKIIGKDISGSNYVLNILVGPTAPNLPVSGQLWVDTTFTGSDATSSYAINAGNANSSSYAATASLLLGSIVSASYALTASFALNGGGGSGSTTNPGGQDTQIQYNSSSVFQGSPNLIFNYTNKILTLTGSLVITGSQVDFSKTSIVSGNIFSSSQFSGSYFGTSSWAFNAITASFAIVASTLQAGSTASYASNSDLLDNKDSTIFATTGSNVFIGNQTITGSLIITGSQINAIGVGVISGSIFSGSQFSGSHFGTSSWALNSITSSYSLITTSASYSSTSSFLLGIAASASYAITSSYVQTSTVDFIPLGKIQIISSTFSSGSNQILTLSTSSFVGIFVDYIIYSGSGNHARAGNFDSVWISGSLIYKESTTNDIGNTTDVSCSVIFSSSLAVFNITTIHNNWNIRAFVKSL